MIGAFETEVANRGGREKPAKWLAIEYEDPWTRGKQPKQHSRRRPQSFQNPWRSKHPFRMRESWSLFASIAMFLSTFRNPILAGRIGSRSIEKDCPKVASSNSPRLRGIRLRAARCRSLY